jgi:hypothetical protein
MKADNWQKKTPVSGTPKNQPVLKQPHAKTPPKGTIDPDQQQKG